MYPTSDHRQAVVLGGGIAGLLTARILSDHFDHVTLVERDSLPDEAVFRGGVPQAHHLHGLLMRGLTIIERLFPGFTADLEAAGAQRVEWMIDSVQLLPSGWTPRLHSGIVTYGCSRVLLETLVRRRVAALPNVHFRAETTAAELVTNPDATRVIGVRLETRDKSHDDILRAGLVIDATGRSSHAPEWLRAIGYPAPEDTVIDAHLGYATRHYRLPDDPQRDWKTMLIMPSPAHPRGGAFTSVEGDRWILTIAGVGGDYPPTDEDGLMNFVRSLPAPQLHEALRQAEPLTPIYGYRNMANRLRHYEKLTRFPEGFAVIGDAVCVFNPQYGQGMSTAALGVEVLEQVLRERVDSLTFQKRLVKSTRQAWQMATNADYRYPTTEGEPASAMTRLLIRYVDWLFAAAPEAPEIAATFLATMHLMKPSTALFHPAIVTRCLAFSLRHRGARQPEPAPKTAQT